ncbi:KLTH0C08954p [Lachancea thermotolerans CBS 6340]|uniref:KLTH0C08954p n=1 Tax=Lachancea thermotolerans (strain ATCC 56472 / CBS 6340 / NRRL Y-8284) TaxID=559295 RepID=C5DEG4_LACTC|nr:KLTH0C08954p [Lachancea thermotolerans CBS 6340]CAR22175.1 KLTH0C08954p [Lachancea thermotolerans CBS 6340]
MSSVSFTKKELLTCIKASSTWAQWDNPNEGLVDLIQPFVDGPYEVKDFSAANSEAAQEARDRVNHLIGKHILKTKLSSGSWYAYTKGKKQYRFALRYCSEPTTLYFKRITRSLSREKQLS